MRKWLLRLSVLVLAIALVAVGSVSYLLRGSLAQLDGQLALPGLSAPVQVERDALGTVTVQAANEADMARALGFVHAQERYFEMDLMRRSSAGELSELFGPVALKMDEQQRVHRIRARVDANLDAFAGDQRAVLQAYTDGVNAGLAALKVRPWPYLLLRQQPKPWTLADSALVGYAMYFDLQDAQDKREYALWRIKPHLPDALFKLLTHAGSEWDAPLQGDAIGNAALPSAAEADLRKLPVADDKTHETLLEKPAPGSNDWAVGGKLTKDGRAIVADDMHLSLRAPNIWFRARLKYAGAHHDAVDVSGFSLPGLPAIIVGSNGHVAWGFTDSYIDAADWKLLPKNAPLHTHDEEIKIAGKPSETLVVRDSDWGPVLHETQDGLLALRWAGDQVGAINFGLSGLNSAKSIDEAFAASDRAGMPAQNLMIADDRGHIAWRLSGGRPQRAGDCDMTTVEKKDCAAWTISSADNAPAIRDPASQRLWTANARTLGGAALATVGDGGYTLGARAKQIRDDLFDKQQFDEKDLLAVQLDDRALFLQRWWTLLEAEKDKGKHLGELAEAAKTWEGRASATSVSYRVVRAWRLAVNARIADGLTAPAQAALGSDFKMPDLPQFEGVAWPLLQQRPLHLLSKRFDSWDALLEDAAKEVNADLSRHGPLAQRGWGERNTGKVCHPLANALPASLKPWLCMPADQLDGDNNMPRVVAPNFGASERMVVSPGHESEGIIHMPGGQSGHPLSPFWGAGHEAWVHDEATPFLPGATQYALTLQP